MITTPALTDRQHEVMALLAEGLTCEEVARRLYLSVQTVKHHVSNAYQALGATGRVEAVLAWLDQHHPTLQAARADWQQLHTSHTAVHPAPEATCTTCQALTLLGRHLAPTLAATA